MKNIAVFPGSFDPITKGHESIIKRALPLFDHMVVGIGVNAKKPGLFPPEQREKWIATLFRDDDRVSVQRFEGLTVTFCRSVNARYIVRGLRNINDFEFEKSIAQMNRSMAPEIETVTLITEAELASISSTIVRDIIRNEGDPSPFLPAGIDIDGNAT